MQPISEPEKLEKTPSQSLYSSARPITVTLRETTKRKLDELEQFDIIQKIQVNSPYEWCSNLHKIPKKNGDVRLTIDPRELNKVIRREFHPMSTIEAIATRVHGSKMISTLDANLGYFQLACTT